MRRHRVGIPGFDEVAQGGLPHGRSTLVAGTSGAGKTLVGLQQRGISGHVREHHGNKATIARHSHDGILSARGRPRQLPPRTGV